MALPRPIANAPTHRAGVMLPVQVQGRIKVVKLSASRLV